MKSYWYLCWFSVCCLAAVTGCGLEGPPPEKHDEAAANKQPESHPAPATTPAPNITPQKPTPRKLAEGQKPGTVRVAAAVGMGEKGRGYGKSYHGVVLRAYWSVQEMIALDQIKHDMQIYKAGEGDGHYPKNIDEFMAKIIKPANIKLPILPRDCSYVYDPTSEDDFLMVEAPEMGDEEQH